MGLMCLGGRETEEEAATREAMGLGFHDGCEWKRHATLALEEEGP